MDLLLASFINMQHMEKALQFTQLISFALLVWRSMTHLPPVMVSNNAFQPLMATKFPFSVTDHLCYIDMRASTDDELAQLKTSGPNDF